MGVSFSTGNTTVTGDVTTTGTVSGSTCTTANGYATLFNNTSGIAGTLGTVPANKKWIIKGVAGGLSGFAGYAQFYITADGDRLLSVTSGTTQGDNLSLSFSSGTEPVFVAGEVIAKSCSQNINNWALVYYQELND